MGFRIATGSIPRGQLLPEGPWTLEIVSLEEGRDEKGCRQVLMTRKTVWPVRGLPDHEYYTIGTDTDPDGTETETQVDSIGAQMLMKCLEIAEVKGLDAPDMDSDELFENAKGCRFDAQCTYVTDDGSKVPENKGKIYKRLMMHKAGKLRQAVRPPEKPPRTVPPPRQPAAPVEAPNDDYGGDLLTEEPAPRASGRVGLTANPKSALPPSRRGA